MLATAIPVPGVTLCCSCHNQVCLINLYAPLPPMLVSCAVLSLQPVWQQLQDKIRACPSNAMWIALLEQQQQQVQRLQQANAQLQQENQLLRQSRDDEVLGVRLPGWWNEVD